MKFHANSPLALIEYNAATFKMKAKSMFSQQGPIVHRTFVPNIKYLFLHSLYLQ
jgi:hypothetical protein